MQVFDLQTVLRIAAALDIYHRIKTVEKLLFPSHCIDYIQKMSHERDNGSVDCMFTPFNLRQGMA